MADKNLLQWDSLRQRLGLGARANKYLVEIVPPRGGEVAVAGQSNVDLSDPGKIVAFCKGTSVPSREMGIAEVWIQGRKIPIPGDAQFAGTWDLTFYNDQDHDLLLIDERHNPFQFSLFFILHLTNFIIFNFAFDHF